MNNAPQQAPSATPPVTTSADARKLAESLAEVMAALLKVVDAETALVRTGKIMLAMDLDPQKSELSRRYVSMMMQFKASHPFLKASTPDLLAALQRQHDAFRTALQTSLTVLATAHAVSEGIVRGVNAELAKRSVPSTYNAYGNHNAPPARRATPLTVSRTL